MTKLDELKDYIKNLEVARTALEDKLIESGYQVFVDRLERLYPYKDFDFPSDKIRAAVKLNDTQHTSDI